MVSARPEPLLRTSQGTPLTPSGPHLRFEHNLIEIRVGLFLEAAVGLTQQGTALLLLLLQLCRVARVDLFRKGRPPYVVAGFDQ